MPEHTVVDRLVCPLMLIVGADAVAPPRSNVDTSRAFEYPDSHPEIELISFNL